MEDNVHISKKLQELSETVRLLPDNAQQTVLHQLEILAATVNQHIDSGSRPSSNASDETLVERESGDRKHFIKTDNVTEIQHIEADSTTKWLKVDTEYEETDMSGTNYTEECHTLKEEPISVQSKRRGSFKKTFVDIEENGQKVIKAEVITKEPVKKIDEKMDCEHDAEDTGDVTDYVIDEEEEESCKELNENLIVEKSNENLPAAKTDEKRPTKCLVCRRLFDSTQDVREHMRVDHNIILHLRDKVKNSEPCICPPENLPEKPEFPCGQCGRRFKAEIGLKQHVARHHTNALSTECDICHKQYDHYKKLMAHKRAAHNTCDHACQHCDYKTKYSMDLKRHILKRHGRYEDFPYQCEVCLKRFVMPNAYKKHVRTHQTEREFIYCEYQGCKFKTISDSSMFLHVKKVHKGIVQSYECEICHVKLGNKQTYQIHMRRHKGDNPYTCSVCNIGFPCTSQLTAHEKIHGEKKEPCTVCGKKFLDKAKVKRHMAVHSDEKKFKCPWCPYKCNLDSNLRKHCQARHNEIYPPKVRNQVSSYPRNIAPFRFKRDSTHSFARSIVMALSKADPAQLASMSACQNGNAGPILYLDTAHNQIILRTEKSDPSLERHPKFTLREENGQYVLVQIPPNQDSKPEHLVSNSYQESVRTPVSNSVDELQLQVRRTFRHGNSLAQAPLHLATAISTVQNTISSSHLEQSQAISYIQNAIPTSSSIEHNHSIDVLQELDVSQDHEQHDEGQNIDMVDMATLQAQLTRDVVERSLRAEDGSVEAVSEDDNKNVDSDLVLTEETLQQLSASSGGSLVLVQPDGSTYEVQLHDNKYRIKPYNPTAEDFNSIKQVDVPEGSETTEIGITDPSQYIQTFDPASMVTSEQIRMKLESESAMTSQDDIKTIHETDIGVSQESGRSLGDSLIDTGISGNGLGTPLTVVRTGTNLNVVYAHGDTFRGEVFEDAANELHLQDNVVINPQDFVNKI